MKNILILFTLILGACSSEYLPDLSGVPSGSLKVVDSKGQDLGFLVAGNSSSLHLISPMGYNYTIDQKGNFQSFEYLYTDSNKQINIDRLYISNSISSSGNLSSRAAYFIKSSSSGGLPNGEFFCHDKAPTEIISPFYYQWKMLGYEYYKYYEKVIGLVGGIKIEICSFQRTGIPEKITPPFKTK